MNKQDIEDIYNVRTLFSGSGHTWYKSFDLDSPSYVGHCLDITNCLTHVDSKHCLTRTYAIVVESFQEYDQITNIKTTE